MHFKFAILGLQTNRKLSQSLQNSFGPIPKFQENFSDTRLPPTQALPPT